MSPMPPPMESPAPMPGPESAPAPESGGDMICVRRYPNNQYQVTMEPMPAEPESPEAALPEGEEPGEQESGGRIEGIEAALKAVYGMDKANPLGESGEAQMAEGFGPPGQMGGE